MRTSEIKLNEIMGEIFPEKSNILIEGALDTTKEIFGLHFLYKGLDEAVCFYAFYGQNNTEVEQQFKSYGMDISEAIKNKKIYWIDAGNSSEGDNVINCDLKNLLTVTLALDQFVKSHPDKKIRGVINLISPAFRMNDQITMYIFLSRLIGILKQADATTVFLLGEGMYNARAIGTLEALYNVVIEVKQKPLLDVKDRENLEIAPMPTLQIRLPRKQIKKIDRLVETGLYPNRSEAVRDAVRRLLEKAS